MPFRLPIRVLIFLWSGSFDDRNLPASCSKALSTVTLTVSTAFAASFSTFAGIFTSCPRAAVALAGSSINVNSTITVLMAQAPLLVRVPLRLLVQPVDLRLDELQLGTRNVQRQYHARAGRFAFGAFLLLRDVVDPSGHRRDERGSRRPLDKRQLRASCACFNPRRCRVARRREDSRGEDSRGIRL